MNKKVIIFDLDGTLHDSVFDLSKDAVEILNHAKENNYIITLASLNSAAERHLCNHKIDHYFDLITYKNWILYGAYKTDLFEAIKNRFGILFSDMILFDDCEKMIKEAQSLGINTVHIDSTTLLSKETYLLGLQQFQEEQKQEQQKQEQQFQEQQKQEQQKQKQEQEQQQSEFKSKKTTIKKTNKRRNKKRNKDVVKSTCNRK